MCIYAFALNPHKGIKLIVAGNRDEYYNRKSMSAHQWDEDKDIIGGLDLKEKGTWLGISKKRKIAFITNYRDPTLIKDDVLSRGKLVKDFLMEELTIDIFKKKLDRTRHSFNGYNIIFGNFDELYYFSNINGQFQKIESGLLHSISNAFLNSNWFKCSKLKEGIKYLQQNNSLSMPKVFSLLSDKEKAPETLLPNTNISRELEKQLSSIYVDINGYGTIFSYFILVKDDYSVELHEYNRLSKNISSFYFKTFDNRSSM